MKVIVHTKVINGVAQTNRKALRSGFAEFNGSEITVTIEKKKKKRSNEQCRYYFGVIVKLIQLAIKDNWGEKWDIMRVHEMLKHELNYTERVNEKTGEIIKTSKSTTENSTVEMEEYQEDCRKWAFEWFNVSIPLPNQQIEIEL